ncbi:glycosyltransferase family 17 protein [Piromyces sp. E2]|nr:glycosyltransferase family 17 protein [Piromyces sp. E2]|eukprot:OUM59017.1 glycosyltransferase family 17 protein [Piromyces sp. E2]
MRNNYHLLKDTDTNIETNNETNIETNNETNIEDYNSVIKKKLKYIILFIILLIAVIEIQHISKIIGKKESGSVFIKGDSRKDKYGIELNKYILNGVYSQGYDNNQDRKIEEWSLYTPQCPHLQPIHLPMNITEPNCENSSLQFINVSNNTGEGYPYSLPLHDISTLMEQFKHWKDSNNSNPDYENQDITQLLDENYHPYDYGFVGDNNANENDSNNDINVIPNPSKRRLFSFIPFDFEFELLDIYLAENYDIIDYFVIFETSTTIIGKPKPFYFTRMLLETNRYDAFKDKIIPIPYEIPVDKVNHNKKKASVDDIINNINIEEGLRAVHARHGDLFIFGTVGDLPKSHVLARLKKCGGWEHLYHGLGNHNGNSDKSKIEKPLSFSSWAYQYSFENVENNGVGTILKPNLGIFDVNRHSTPDSGDGHIQQESDVYASYRNYNVLIKDSLTTKNKAILWNAGWHMTSFIPTMAHIYAKLLTIFDLDPAKPYHITYDIINSMENKTSIFYENKKFVENNPKPKVASTKEYPYNFDYNYWKAETTQSSQKFKYNYEVLKREVPHQIGKNSVCYNYMFERKFGFNKPLWWQVISKNEWETVNLNKLDYRGVGSAISPFICPTHLEDLHVMSVDETLDDIINNNRSISRLGDGEYTIILGTGLGSTFQKPDEVLVERMKKVLFNDDNNFIVGISDEFKSEISKQRTDGWFWNLYKEEFGGQLLELFNLNKIYGSAMISRYYMELYDKSGVPKYIEKLKKIWDNRDILIIEGEYTRVGIGNDLLDNAKSIQRIIGPARSAFDVYDKIYEEVLKHDKDKLIIIALGQTATVLAFDLYKAGYQAIDFGHIDLEYEWYKRNATEKINIEYKFVSEVKGGMDNIQNVTDPRYEQQIITRIQV